MLNEFPSSPPIPPGSAGGPLFAPPVLPVSLLVSSARLLLERQLGLAWVAGEISDCKRATSGHLYFKLKDAAAQVQCVFFRYKAQGLAFQLKNGLAVEAFHWDRLSMTRFALPIERSIVPMRTSALMPM